MRSLVSSLDPALSLDAELLARRRALRALETTEALDDGVRFFIARESFELGGDADPVVADQTRVAADHWLVSDFPDRFEVALQYPIGRKHGTSGREGEGVAE